MRAAEEEGVGPEELRDLVEELTRRDRACRRVTAEEHLLAHRRRLVGTWERLTRTAEQASVRTLGAPTDKVFATLAFAQARTEEVLLRASEALYGVDTDLSEVAPEADDDALDLGEAQEAERLPEEDW